MTLRKAYYILYRLDKSGEIKHKTLLISLAIIIAVASVALIGFAINAFAHGGMGWGGGWGHHGMGWHHRGDYGPGYDDQMSKEQYQQFEQKKEAFFKETQDLRANLHEKERELQNELVKDDLDAAKASAPYMHPNFLPMD